MNRSGLARAGRFALVSMLATAGTLAVSEGNAAVDSSNDTQSGGLEEIIVTAQKKSERLQDVPIPMTVLDAQSLADNGHVLLADYFSTVPGLNFSPNYGNGTTLTVRGIAADAFGNPTVAVLIDDLPFTTATSNDGNNIPNLDPGDLEHVEVLRGPQGTLYGASSLGGVIKYVTKDPSTDAVSGRFEAGTSTVKNGAEPGFNVRGAINVPLSDTIAMRASAFVRQDPGYIDNVGTHTPGVNEAQATGGRLVALWRPSEDFSVKLAAVDQNIRSNGLSEVNQAIIPSYAKTANLGDLQQNYIPNTGESDQALQEFSATVKANLGGFQLTSLTGYMSGRTHWSVDASYVFGGNTNLRVETFDTKFSQELRLLVPLGPKFEWLVGGYFTNENSRFGTLIYNQDANANRIGTLEDARPIPLLYKSYAAFTDFTYHVTDRLDVQVGGRESKEINSVPGQPDANDNAFTYLLTPQFKLTSDLMLYARLASGFRPGGPNTPPACGEVDKGVPIPCSFAPDKTQNYEVGFKGDFLDHLISLDASLYYIKWKDFQMQLTSPGVQSYITNGADGKSQGVEFSATVRPLTGSTVTAWVSYDDAVLTDSFPRPGTSVASDPTIVTRGGKGDRLPYSARISGYLSLDQEFPLGNATTGSVGGSLSYIGDRENIFVPEGTPRIRIPPYAKIDLHAGVKYDLWAVNLYANNVEDRRGILNNSIANNLFPYAYVIIPPRTIGVNVSRTF